ncbi:MAG: ADP-ribosylglycohydrolase family protein [Arcanobacterium sp.]
MNSQIPTVDRFAGALLGLAAGDALGGPVEFHERDAHPPTTGMAAGGYHQLTPGQWTDDTSMALCMARSIVETGSFDLKDQLDRYSRWFNEGYMSSKEVAFGIGRQTWWAIADYALTGTAERENIDPNSCGNGSLMRLAPAAMIFANDVEAAARASAASSLTTHPANECVEACAAYGVLIVEALNGKTKEDIFDTAAEWAPRFTSPAIQQIMAGSFRTKPRDEISSSGYVLHTLEAALWCFANTEDFATGALAAVNLGGDTDTTAAVYGQLAGAYYGQAAIPEEWLDVLHERDFIAETARGIHGLVGKVTL